jgi:hypothetical protein
LIFIFAKQALRTSLAHLHLPGLYANTQISARFVLGQSLCALQIRRASLLSLSFDASLSSLELKNRRLAMSSKIHKHDA